MRKFVAVICIMLFLFPPALAGESGYWEGSVSDNPVCAEGREGCLLLQTVMFGSFRDADTEDNLSRRVLSAALEPLASVSDDDIAHFCEEFGEDEPLVRSLYYDALGSCLLADILLNPADGPAAVARTVLLVFLDPEAMDNGQSQMDSIRAELDEADCDIIAEASGMPAGFVRQLLMGTDAAISGTEENASE